MGDAAKTITRRASGRGSPVPAILHLVEDHPGFAQLEEALLADGKGTADICGLSGSANAFLLAAWFLKHRKPMLVFTSSGDAASRWRDDLSSILGENEVCRFPTWEISPYEFRRPAAELIGQRLDCLHRLQQGKPVVVVTHLRAAVEQTLPPAEFDRNHLSLSVERDIPVDDVLTRLVDLGYERASLVEEASSFAHRGGIIDVFTYAMDNPVRIEFFGDTVDSIRSFSVSSQRSIHHLKECVVLPAREVLADRAGLVARLNNVQANGALQERVGGDPDYPGLEWLAEPLGYERSTIVDYLPDDTVVWIGEPTMYELKREEIANKFAGFHRRTAQAYEPVPAPDRCGEICDQLLEQVRRHPLIRQHDFRRKGLIDFETGPAPAFASQVKKLVAFLRDREEASRSVWILCDTEPHRKRLSEILEAEGGVPVTTHLSSPGVHEGFSIGDGDTLLTDHQIFERHFKQYRRRRFKEGIALSSYNQLSKGDYVVHVDHGIGRFRGLQRITVGHQERDCLLILYHGDDKLFVPIEEFNRVQKFSGKEGSPKLSRLGGTAWEKAKRKTKRALMDMAAELVRLYAERKSRSGFSFSEDNEWQKQLEASFAYEETPDQLKAINEVKQDLQSSAPADRLICGDVGYGKTEVAIRAAFKAITDGKQVAVLVPTTILAEQHLNTFRERLADFPIKIEMLSRFRTARQQKEIITELSAGRIDIVIGTHRLLSKDVDFGSLGLLVVDEEQHFGVAHKEKIRRLKTLVDTITLTATPIPRTLQMSLLGARDMSLIATSPRNRLPIHTEIREFSPEVIVEAARQELQRGGQIFFVHNRVRSIGAMASFLQRVLPEMRLGIAHGQMKERELERIMVDFLNKKFDCLLSTAIIESGLDIPSVNTIIINRADRFGLSQLYQLRGRVGRSHRRAYAYLLTPPFSALTPVARKRLKALAEHTALGSGFHLAMRDLEIRGAGNLLGPQQHGFIEEIGFDLYCRLLEEAVAELKGEEPPSPAVMTTVEFPDEVFIPDDYIPDNQQRFEVYKRLADAGTTHDLDDIRVELADRFGASPPAVEMLLNLAYARVIGTGSHVARVMVNQETGALKVEFEDTRPIGRSEIERWRKHIADSLTFSPGPPFVMQVAPAEPRESALDRSRFMKQTLEKL